MVRNLTNDAPADTKSKRAKVSKKARGQKDTIQSGPSKQAELPHNEKQVAPAEPSIAPLRPNSSPPIFFFKDDEEPYGFLCQWYRCHFTDPESSIEFNCAEQFMMWHKARMANDAITAAEIMAATSPRKQKQLGREVVGFDANEWDKIKLDVVEQGNYLKFTQGTNTVSIKMDDTRDPVPLKGLLLATEERELVEASRFDRVWGIGFDAQKARSMPREKWGRSLLGEALMNVRERIRREM